MKDTIYKEDAIKALRERWARTTSYDGIGEDIGEECEEVIEAIPSADRPQGEWIRTGRTNIYGGIEVQCSNCGDKVMVQHLEDEWYCRHCGADMGMKGADDDEV